jgi:hypothetical protein
MEKSWELRDCIAGYCCHNGRERRSRLVAGYEADEDRKPHRVNAALDGHGKSVYTHGKSDNQGKGR